MELTVTQEKLSKALNAVGRVASSKSQLPILNNILLKTEGNRLLVAATNLEMAVTEYIGAKVISPGAITIPARLMADFIHSLPSGTIKLKEVRHNLNVTSGSYKSVINGVIADEFPELPTIAEDSSIQYNIDKDTFKQAVQQTIIATSNDMARPVLTGVYWHTVNGVLYLAGTDGYRLAERQLFKTSSAVNAIIPASTLQEVLRVLGDEVEEVDVLFDDIQVRFRMGTTEIISKLIDGNYPDYKQLIPETTATFATAKKEDFIKVTKVAGLFAREVGGSLSVNINDNLISLHSVASQLGENTSDLKAKTTGEGSITLNSRYLSEALAAIDGKDIYFGFDGKLAPALLYTPQKDVNYYHIIMPLKS